MTQPRTVLSAGVLAAFLALPGAASADPGERSVRLIGLFVTLAAQRASKARGACPEGHCRKAVRSTRDANRARRTREQLALGISATGTTPVTR